MYAILLVATQWVLQAHAFSRPLVIAISLLPMLAVFGVAGAGVAQYYALDELQRRITSEGLMFGFVVTAVLSLAYGFLESAEVVPRLSAFVVWPTLAAGWIVGTLAAKRRYR